MIHQTVIFQFSKMLGNMSAILDKSHAFATTKKIDDTILWQSRLAVDQFNFIRQIQILCDTAKMTAASLAGKDAPVHEDNEQTFAQLKSRINSVVTYLNSFNEKDFDGALSRKVTRPRWEGKYLTGEEFLVEHAVPNFYFHLTTAYAILRHLGVDIGKKDYLGDLPYKVGTRA